MMMAYHGQLVDFHPLIAVISRESLAIIESQMTFAEPMIFQPPQFERIQLKIVDEDDDIAQTRYCSSLRFPPRSE